MPQPDKRRRRVVRLDTILDAESDSEKPLKADPVRNLWFSDAREADTFLLAEEEDTLLDRAKNRLRPMFRKCCDLLAWGKSHKDIAHLTGTSVSKTNEALSARLNGRFLKPPF